MENGGSWQVSSHDPGPGPLQGRSTNPQRFPAAKELGPGGAGRSCKGRHRSGQRRAGGGVWIGGATGGRMGEGAENKGRKKE